MSSSWQQQTTFLLAQLPVSAPAAHELHVCASHFSSCLVSCFVNCCCCIFRLLDIIHSIALPCSLFVGQANRLFTYHEHCRRRNCSSLGQWLGMLLFRLVLVGRSIETCCCERAVMNSNIIICRV